jgi:hypothetical protein
MTRALYVSLDESDVISRCHAKKVGVSAIEPLPEGGVRLVCMSVGGAETMRSALRLHMIKEEVTRLRHRPTRPLW